MSKKTKKLFIASIIIYFLPLIAATFLWVYLINKSSHDYLRIFMVGFPTIPGLFVYLVTPLFKKHYYETAENPRERKSAIITTSIQCGAPVLIELICLATLFWLFVASPGDLLLKIIYIISFLPFYFVNTAFWRSFPKEEKKEA